MKATKNLQPPIGWLKNSVWAFPVVLLVIFLGLVCFKVHGSSIGVYHTALYGETVEDPDLLFGKPKSIRSDEWLGSTQLTALQAESGFPEFNELVAGSGRDLTKVADAPIADWVTIFRPHNWSFFVMSFEHAFSFRWWLLSYMLIVSCYFFTLRLLGKRQKLFSTIFSIAIGFSPFVLWWYQPALSLALAYGFLILILGIRIIDNEKIPKINSNILTKLLYAGALAFVGTALGLLLYPPFSIPIVLVVSAFLLGYIVKRKQESGLSIKSLLKRLSVFAISILIAASAGLTFVNEHRDMIKKVSGSLYPGERTTESGGTNLLTIFDGFLMPALQGDFRGTHYYNNQSEASNFILLLPFLLLPGVFLQAYEYRKRRKVDWPLLFIHAIALLFFIRAFTPLGDFLFNLMLLDRVPNERLLIGFGFVGIIQLIYVLRKIRKLKLPQKQLIALSVGYGLACLLVLLWIGDKVVDEYPQFIGNHLEVAGFAILFTSIIVAFLLDKRLLGAVLLLIFSVGSSFKIMPVYKELDFLQESQLIKKVQSVSSPQDDWVSLDSLYFENVPLAAGRGQVGGSQLYPDIEYWQKIDGGKYENVYNRQGHAVFSTEPSLKEDFTLIQPNYYKVKFRCSKFIVEDIEFVLSPNPIDYPCTELIDTVIYPKTSFYIYKIN